MSRRLARFALLAVLLAGTAGSSPDPGEMVYVPPGPVLLGGPTPTAMPGPVLVELDGFWIDRFEVTNAEYMAFVEATGHRPPMFADDPAFSRPDQPVTGVSWDDAEAYCRWRGKRLPTELEWEKAARGTDGRLYPWGDGFGSDLAYLEGELPAAVGSHPADVSPYGVYDMAGNVSEWVADMFVAGFACETGFCPVPEKIREEDFRAFLRGGHFQGLPHMAKVYERLFDYPDTVAEFFGFRCVRPANDGRV